MDALHQLQAARESAFQKLKQLKPDAFEIFTLFEKSREIEAKDQKIDSLTQSEDLGLCLRVQRGNRTGFGFTTSLSPEALDRTVKLAWETTEFLPEDPHSVLEPLPKDIKRMNLEDPEGLKVDESRKIQMALDLERLTLSADPRMKAVRSASISESYKVVHLMDTSGAENSYAKTLFGSSVSAKAQENDEAQMGYDSEYALNFKDLDVSVVAKRAAHYATELLGSKTPDTQKVPAIFRNDVVAGLLGFLLPSFSAEQIDKGRSLLRGRISKQVFSEKLSLVDDGLMENGVASRPFDAEGTPSRKTSVINQGVFTQPLCDLYYSRKLGLKPTASAARGLQSTPSTACSNFGMVPGDPSFEALIQGTQKGILITSLMGIHTANPVTGDFSLGASGILIENGELTQPVRGFAVAGKLLEVFRQITDIGNDIRFFGRIGAASLKVNQLTVSGR